jgi:carbon storage regulator
MLVLSRKEGERLILSNGVTIVVVKLGKHVARIGIDAPADVRIDREEVHLLRKDKAEGQKPA